MKNIKLTLPVLILGTLAGYFLYKKYQDYKKPVLPSQEDILAKASAGLISIV